MQHARSGPDPQDVEQAATAGRSAEPAAASGLSLATHRWARLPTFMLLYMAQGAPEGLLYVAIPGWLAASGVPPAAIGGYIAVIVLPWSLKFFNGFLMDRFAFLPMGRRRPWLIGAQVVLIATLAAFAVLDPGAGAPELAALTALGFLVNVATAFQDVATDGMAIDVTPEGERARANGVMRGGKTLGIAAGAAVCTFLIQREGLAAAALATAGFTGLVMLAPIFLRERPGERLAPWSRGDASILARERQLHSWLAVLREVLAAMIRPRSLLLSAGVFIAFISHGIETALGSVFAVQQLGWTQERYGALVSASNLIGGLFGLLLSGVIADALKPHRALALSLLLIALFAGAMAAGPAVWSAPRVFEAFILVYGALFVLLSVSVYAEAMAASRPQVAATQFALFMAVLNLGTSFGAARFAGIQPQAGYGAAFLVSAAASLLAIPFFLAAARTARRDARDDVTPPPASPQSAPDGLPPAG